MGCSFGWGGKHSLRETLSRGVNKLVVQACEEHLGTSNEEASVATAVRARGQQWDRAR